MKFIIIFYLSFLGGILLSQNVSHVTISNLEVSYREPDVRSGVDSLNLVWTQCIIALKNDSNVTKLYLKVLDVADSSIIDQVTYAFESSPALTPDGQVLFKKQGNLCYVNLASSIPFKLYLFQVTTENLLGEVTPIYSDLK